MAHVYILKTRIGTYYVGSTDDLGERLRQHRIGKVKTTKTKLPIVLVFQEWFATRGEAQAREYRIKGWKSKKLIDSLVSKVGIHGPIV